MEKRSDNYNIVFEKRDLILEEENFNITFDAMNELDEINDLRDIVLDMETPKRFYITST